MNFLDAVMWRLSRAKKLNEVTAAKMAKSMGVSTSVMGRRLVKEGWTWTRLKDRELCNRYHSIKAFYGDIPPFRIAQKIGCSHVLVYRKADRWDKHPYRTTN